MKSLAYIIPIILLLVAGCTKPSKQSDPESLATEESEIVFKGDSIPVEIVEVSEDIYANSETYPLRGRAFVPEDWNRNAKVAAISFDLWEKYFEGKHEIIGATIDIEGIETSVVSVATPSTALQSGCIVWIPKTQ